MVEAWTRERRLEHTRSLLLDAAEEVFAEKGFTPATLDDIAGAAGYTKGAIYKHFATKEDLFLAVSDRYWRRYFDNFAEVMATAKQIGARELDEIAERWRRLSVDRAPSMPRWDLSSPCIYSAIPMRENGWPPSDPRSSRRWAKFIVEGIGRIGGTLQIPALTFAQVLVATSDAIILGSELDDVDLYRPIIEMYVSAIKLP